MIPHTAANVPQNVPSLSDGGINTVVVFVATAGDTAIGEVR